MTWNSLVPPRLRVTARPGWCLQYAQSVFNAPVMHETAWIAWQNQQFRHGPSEPLPDVPVLLWFSHWATYNGVYMNWGHVAVLVPGDAIYSSPSTPLGSPPSFERYGTIQEVERRFSSTYVGWSEDINTLRVAAWTEDETDTNLGDDEMTKPMLAMKLDHGPMHTLGVMIDPDGAVTGLTSDQWGFWVHTAKVVPVECVNPGHWEYLMGVMEDRRKRSGLTISDEGVKRIVNSVRDALGSPKVSAAEIAEQLKISVK